MIYSFEEPTPMEIDEFGVDGGGTPSYSNEETADIESGSKVLLGELLKFKNSVEILGK